MTDLREQLQTTLGSAFLIERELGGGGMSRVFVAEETRLHRKVVVKVLSPELAAGVSAERFEREIQLAAALQQANIVPLLSAGDTNGLPFFTMPFVDGLSLRARLARNSAMPVAEVVSVLRDVLRALAYAHDHGVIHRDIKPENILLSGDAAVVTDFGIAKALSASRTQAPGGTLTQVGTSIGTPAYMAPEQAAGDPDVDHRADLYALGCVAYEMLVGAPPFAGRPVHQIFAAHMTEAPAPIGPKRTDVPRDLAALVMRSLEKDTSRRPQSAREMLQTLDASASGERVRKAARPRRMVWAMGAALAGAVVIAAVAWTRRSESVSAAAPTSDRSIAVLPFSNPGNDSAQTYFAEGVADELTTAMAKIPGLRVASRSAAFAAAKSATSAQEAGRTLKVSTVLEGSVRRSGKRLRISAQLTNVADGFAVWSDAFERDTGDVFTAQDELSRRITTALHDKLAVAEGGAITTARGTRDPEAYDLYLRGRYFWARRGETGLRRAASLFSDAIRRDSTFARAWAGLAMVQVVLPEYISTSGDTLITAGLRSAERAIAIDPNVGEGHLALAYGLISRWEWQRSEASFKKALALLPNDPSVHQWYGDMLVVVGRLPQALDELSRAQALDPGSAIITSEMGNVLYNLGRNEEAVAMGRKALELDSLLVIAYSTMAQPFAVGGPVDSSLAYFAKEQRMTAQQLLPREQAYLAYALTRAGRVPDARRIAAEVDAKVARRQSAAFWAFTLHAVLGDTTDALRWLTLSADRHEVEGPMAGVLCEPMYGALLTDPRFVAQLARMHLANCIRK